MKGKPLTPTKEIGKRSTRRKLSVGVETKEGWLIPLYTVDVPTPSKYRPHQGEREKARRLKQLEKQ